MEYYATFQNDDIEKNLCISQPFNNKQIFLYSI